MRYKVVKLDGRYAHKDAFRYMLEFVKDNLSGTGVRDYDQACRWFNDQFGWSQEVEVRTAMIKNWNYHRSAYSMTDFNTTWAYCARYSRYRIYIATEKELEWFLLCHPQV